MSEPTETSPPKRHPLRWAIATLCLCAALAVVAWWVAGKRVWTDDRSIAVRDSDAALREVLWTKPVPPNAAFTPPEEESDPRVSPDGNEFYFVGGKAGRNADISVGRRDHGRGTAPAALTDVNSPADDLGP